MRIFDFHTHPAYDFHNDELGYVITPELFVNGLREDGVSFCAGSVIHKAASGREIGEYGAIIRELNAEAYEFYRAFPDFYAPGIHVHPAFPEISCDEIREYAAKGVKLVGELVPYLMGWSAYSDPRLGDILDVAEARGMILSVHPSNIADMEALAKRNRHLKIVVAHIDGYGLYDGEVALMRKYDNVYCDISAHGADRKGMLRQAIASVGKERILMGSDYPGYRASEFISIVTDSGISDDEREAILWQNGAKLFGM